MPVFTMAKMPSINNVIGLPSELFGLPPSNSVHMREIAKRFWEIRWLAGLCEKALADWSESVAVRSLPEYIAHVHDDGDPFRYTVDGYGAMVVDFDGSIEMIPQEILEEEEQCKMDSL